MAEGINNALKAPQDKRAVIVLEGGVTVSLRIKTREELRIGSSVTEGKIEIGYKISDGIIDDQDEISIEGIITGSSDIATPFNMSALAGQAQSLRAAAKAREFCSIYTSFIAMSQCKLVRATITVVPDKNAYDVKLTARQIETVQFARSRTQSKQAPKTKTKNPAGKGKVTAGKKSATPVDAKKEPQKYTVAAKIWRTATGKS